MLAFAQLVSFSLVHGTFILTYHFEPTLTLSSTRASPSMGDLGQTEEDAVHPWHPLHSIRFREHRDVDIRDHRCRPYVFSTDLLFLC